MTLYRLLRWIRKKILYPIIWRSVNRDIKTLVNITNKKQITHHESYNIAYLRSEFWAKSDRASGAIAHTKGVVEGLSKLKNKVTVYSGFPLEFFEGQNIKNIVVKPRILSYDIDELQELEFNKLFYHNLLKDFKLHKYSFIYQRYSLNNFTGIRLSKEFGIPLILEYNGSELWMAKHWKNGLKHKDIAEKIELVNINSADLIISNATPLKEELVSRGISGNKICVIPNGVDPSRFYPELDGSSVRLKYGIPIDSVLVGFIGTFGPWHGAEILAKATGDILKVCPNAHIIFVGDGLRLPLVKNIISSKHLEKSVTFTGMIPQLQTPQYLASCDILVSPQIANPDGTSFFGSPTKLFEYMAMSKGIVASNLDQIGEIIQHNETGILVNPGECGLLAQEIIRLIHDPVLRKKLGINARKRIIQEYTWERHVENILNYIKYKLILN